MVSALWRHLEKPGVDYYCAWRPSQSDCFLALSDIMQYHLICFVEQSDEQSEEQCNGRSNETHGTPYIPILRTLNVKPLPLEFNG